MIFKNTVTNKTWEIKDKESDLLSRIKEDNKFILVNDEENKPKVGRPKKE